MLHGNMCCGISRSAPHDPSRPRGLRRDTSAITCKAARVRRDALLGAIAEAFRAEEHGFDRSIPFTDIDPLGVDNLHSRRQKWRPHIEAKRLREKKQKTDENLRDPYLTQQSSFHPSSPELNEYYFSGS